MSVENNYLGKWMGQIPHSFWETFPLTPCLETAGVHEFLVGAASFAKVLLELHYSYPWNWWIYTNNIKVV